MSALSVQEIRAAIDGTGTRRITADMRIDSAEQRSDGTMSVRGYAAVFDTPANIAGLFVERVKRGAFRKALAAPTIDVPLLFDHQGQPIARTTNGTLRLVEDARGLRFEADIAPTTLGKDLRTLIDRGDLSKMSFGFRTEPDGISWRYATPGSGALDERDVHEFSALNDVSVVTRPAYGDTAVELAQRSMDPTAGTVSEGDERSTPHHGQRGSIRGALRTRLRQLEQETQ